MDGYIYLVYKAPPNDLERAISLIAMSTSNCTIGQGFQGNAQIQQVNDDRCTAEHVHVPFSVKP